MNQNAQPQKRKKVWIFIFACFALSLTLWGVSKTKQAAYADENHAYGNNYSKTLENMPVVAQETAYTCGPASMVVVHTYLGQAITENAVRQAIGTADKEGGMLAKKYAAYSNQLYAPLGYSLAQKNPKSKAEIINTIGDSLADDLPVVLLFSTENAWNKPQYDTHYSVIYGLDTGKQTVQIVNVYGYAEELTFDELYAGLNFSNFPQKPLSLRLGIFAGAVQENTLFILEKAEQ